MKNNILSFFNLLKPPLKTLRRIFYSGNNRFCPVCECSSSAFLPLGQRADARCVVCGSLEGCDLYLMTRYCARTLAFSNSGDNLVVNSMKALPIKAFIDLRRYYMKVAPH